MRRSLYLLAIVSSAVFATACGGSSSGSGPGPAPDPDPDPNVGLDARPSNLACVAPSLAPEGQVQVVLERVFEGLSFSQPLGMMQAPGDDSRWYVLEKGGTVRAFANQPDVAVFDNNFIDLTDTVNDSFEGGLLGMAFHPEYGTNNQVFVSWTRDRTTRWCPLLRGSSVRMAGRPWRAGPSTT